MVKGLRLKSLREDNNLYQKDVANYLKIPRSTYADYERGKNSIPIEVLYKIAVFYKVSIQYICGLTDRKEPYGDLKKFNNKRFLNKFIELRKEKKMSREDLAQLLHCSKITICRYETGIRKISLETIIELVNFYMLPIDYILDVVKD